MKLEQCTKWELLKLISSLQDQKEIMKKLNEVEHDRERVKLYIQRIRNYKPVATIYDVQDFKGEQAMPKYIEAVETAEKISEKYGIPLHELVDIFAEIPAADVKKVVHAKWERDDGMDLVCAACGRLALTSCYAYVQYRSAYCPHCGAKMDGGENE